MKQNISRIEMESQWEEHKQLTWLETLIIHIVPQTPPEVISVTEPSTPLDMASKQNKTKLYVIKLR